MTVSLEVLKTQTSQIHDEVSRLAKRVDNGLSERMTRVEHNVLLLEQRLAETAKTVEGFKSFIGKVAVSLIAALILSTVTGYIAMQNRSSTLEKQLDLLQRKYYDAAPRVP